MMRQKGQRNEVRSKHGPCDRPRPTFEVQIRCFIDFCWYSTASLLTHTYLCARDLICTLSQANRTLDLEQKQGHVILA